MRFQVTFCFFVGLTTIIVADAKEYFVWSIFTDDACTALKFKEYHLLNDCIRQDGMNGDEDSSMVFTVNSDGTGLPSYSYDDTNCESDASPGMEYDVGVCTSLPSGTSYMVTETGVHDICDVDYPAEEQVRERHWEVIDSCDDADDATAVWITWVVGVCYASNNDRSTMYTECGTDGMTATLEYYTSSDCSGTPYKTDEEGTKDDDDSGLQRHRNCHPSSVGDSPQTLLLLLLLPVAVVACAGCTSDTVDTAMVVVWIVDACLPRAQIVQ
jgi:hypothetical protein